MQLSNKENKYRPKQRIRHTYIFLHYLLKRKHTGKECLIFIKKEKKCGYTECLKNNQTEYASTYSSTYLTFCLVQAVTINAVTCSSKSLEELKSPFLLLLHLPQQPFSKSQRFYLIALLGGHRIKWARSRI